MFYCWIQPSKLWLNVFFTTNLFFFHNPLICLFHYFAKQEHQHVTLKHITDNVFSEVPCRRYQSCNHGNVGCMSYQTECEKQPKRFEKDVKIGSATFDRSCLSWMTKPFNERVTYSNDFPLGTPLAATPYTLSSNLKQLRFEHGEWGGYGNSWSEWALQMLFICLIICHAEWRAHVSELTPFIWLMAPTDKPCHN